jgi:hypothetical protein
MRTKITLILLVCILVGCAKNADIESVNIPSDPVTQTVLPKISKDISVLSSDDAINVANLFSHGKVLTKSETLKDVRNVVPIKDASDRTLMYAVNYDDGYAIVSATKNYHPVLAVVDHGTYTGEKIGTGQDVLMNEYMVATEAAMDGEISVDKSVWSEYEEVPFQFTPQTKVSDEYNDVVNQYTGEWYQAGYNIYRLNQKPENMPDDMYAEFCENASFYDRPDHDYMRCSFIIEDIYDDVSYAGPLCQSGWGQKAPYNSALQNPDVMSLGCATIAETLVMSAIEYPTYICWPLLTAGAPGVCNSHLASFLAEVRTSIGGDPIYGGATLSDVRYSMKFDYLYDEDNGWALNVVNHTNAYITPSLNEGIPIIMSGADNTSGLGHVWVCDGYRSTIDCTRYALYVIPMSGEITELQEIENREIYQGSTFFYHMNWGFYGQCDGYYLDNNIAFTINSIRHDFKQNRNDLIISHE